MKRDDDTIRNLFQQLREDDERYAPSFGHVWNVALAQRKVTRRRWGAWKSAGIAAAVSVAAAILMVVTLLPPPRTTKPDRLVDGSRVEAFDFDMMSPMTAKRLRDASVVSWNYPTDYLLRPELSPKLSMSRLELQPLPN